MAKNNEEEKQKENFLMKFLKDVVKALFSTIRGLMIFVVVWIILIVFFASFGYGLGLKGGTDEARGVYYEEKIIANESSWDKIVIVNMDGIISSNSQEDFLGGQISGITPEKFEDVFLQVKKDPDVKAVIFDINSGGGSPTASDRIYEQIVNFRRNSGIPVIFLFSDMAASGAYYIACASDFIVANPMSLTGSIGVIMESFNLEGLYDKIGVDKITLKKGEYKDILNENREITDEEKAILDKLSENTYQTFINRVTEGRNLDREEVVKLATGEIFSGARAYELKLVDSLGNRDEAIYQAERLASIERAKVVEYRTRSVFGDFLSGINFHGISLENIFSSQSNLVRSRI